MSKISENLKYTKEHEWIHIEGDIATIGITEYAQNALGDVVYVDFPSINNNFEAGVALATIESVKAVSEVYNPIQGTLIEINSLLKNKPENINTSPYENGWLFKIKFTNLDNTMELINSVDYETYLKTL